jgi:hypothetical protein
MAVSEGGELHAQTMSPKATMSQDVVTGAPYRYAVGLREEPACSEQLCLLTVSLNGPLGRRPRLRAQGFKVGDESLQPLRLPATAALLLLTLLLIVRRL